MARGQARRPGGRRHPRQPLRRCRGPPPDTSDRQPQCHRLHRQHDARRRRRPVRRRQPRRPQGGRCGPERRRRAHHRPGQIDGELTPLAGPMPSAANDELVGRASLLADVSGWLTPALAGRGRAVLLTGEAGIGKSTLVDAVCSWATGTGFLVGRGWCSEAGMPAYWPWRRALSGLPPGVQFAVASGEPDERAVLLAAVVDTLEEAGRRQPLLIAIDDLHWADPSSLLLLRTVVDAVPTLAVAVVLTARDDALVVDAATRAAIAELPTAVRRVPVP